MTKGNDGTGNNSSRDEWQTPQWLFDILNKQYKFEFDCCASDDNYKFECYSKEFSSIKSLDYIAWMNPPFSKSMYMFKHFFKVVKKGVAIYRCDNMETKVWQEVILKDASWVFIPKGRVSYTPFDVGDMRKGMGTRFPSALIGFNVEPPKGLEGTTLFPDNQKNKGKNGTE